MSLVYMLYVACNFSPMSVTTGVLGEIALTCFEKLAELSFLLWLQNIVL